jgi:hypothetical protein
VQPTLLGIADRRCLTDPAHFAKSHVSTPPKGVDRALSLTTNTEEKPMEFLVEFDVHVPDGTPASEVEQ